MKRTQRIDTFVNIKKTIVSFISIVIFITCGMGIFLGLDWANYSLKVTLDEAFEEGSFHDLEIYFPYGYSDEDLESIKSADGVDSVEKQYYAYEYFYLGASRYQAKIVSITYSIDKFKDLEGRLPMKDNEVVIDKTAANSYGLNIGDTICLENENAKDSYLYNQILNGFVDPQTLLLESSSEEYSYLKDSNLTIVGIAESPEYYSKSRSAYGVSFSNAVQVDIILFVNYSQLNEEVTGGYNSLLIRSDSLRNLSSFSDEYQDAVNKLSVNLSETLTSISKGRFEKLNSNIDGMLCELEQRLDTSQNEIEEYSKKLEQKEQELIDARETLNSYKTQLSDAQKELETASKELQDANELLEEGKAKLDSAKTEYSAALKEYETYKSNYELVAANFDTAYSAKETALSYLQESLDLSYVEFVVFANNNLQDILDVIFDETSNAVLYEYIYELDASEYSSIATNLKVYENEYGDFSNLVLITHPYTTVYEYYQELIDFENEILEKTKNYYPSLAPYAENKLSEAKSELDDAAKKISDGEEEYNEQLSEYNLALKEYSDNETLLKTKQEEIENFEVSLEEASLEIEYAKEELELAKESYNEAQVSYLKFKNANSKTDDYGTISLERVDNAIYIYNKLECDALTKVKNILGGLFLVLSILVSYSVISRIVNDQKKQIGAKKAFGFKDSEIRNQYLFYVGFAFICGLILSIALAFAAEYFIVPLLTKNVYTYKVVGNYYSLKLLAVLALFEFVFMQLSALLACNKTLKQSSIVLLSGNNTASHKLRWYQKTGLYKKLPTLKQTIINNTVNDPRRVFATLIGIAGATALIVSSVSMRNDVIESYDTQYKDYFHFDILVNFDSQVEGSQEKIEEILLENNLDSCPVYYTRGYSYSSDSKKLMTELFVFENEEDFKKFITLESAGEDTYNYKGVWFPQAIKSYYNLSDNEPMTYETLTGEKANLNAEGFFKLYSYNLICFMDLQTYEEEFGKSIEPNSLMVYAGNADLNDLRLKLTECEGFTDIYEYYRDDVLDCEVFKLIANAVVGVYLIVAILMSIFVLLNLLLTYVQEKKKEITILMINGYSMKDAGKYISVDTTILTVIGIVIGVFIGIWAGKLAVNAFSSEYVKLNDSVNIIGVSLGVGITAILSFIMSGIATKKLKKFTLIDIEN